MTACSAQSQLKQLQTGDFSDFRIVCRNKEFRVHRVVICAESVFFDTMCKSQFKEASEAQVDLSEDDPDTVSRVLLYLYTKDYSHELPTGIGFARPYHDAPPSAETAVTIPETQIASKPAPRLQSRTKLTSSLFGATKPQLSEAEAQKRLEAHVAVYVCADRFGIVALQQKACQYFMKLAFDAENAYYEKPFFALILRHIDENTMTKTAVHDTCLKHGCLRKEVTMRMLRPSSSSFDNLLLIKEFEPMAYEIAVVKNETIQASEKEELATMEELIDSRSEATKREASLQARITELESRLAKKAEKKVNVHKATQNHKRQQDVLMQRLSVWLAYPQACHNCRTFINYGWEISIPQGGQNVDVTCPRCRSKTAV